MFIYQCTCNLDIFQMQYFCLIFLLIYSSRFILYVNKIDPLLEHGRIIYYHVSEKYKILRLINSIRFWF